MPCVPEPAARVSRRLVMRADADQRKLDFHEWLLREDVNST